MQEFSSIIMTVLALVGLSVIIGLAMRYFDKGNTPKKESNEQFMVNTAGSGCGILLIIFGFGGTILGILSLFFS